MLNCVFIASMTCWRYDGGVDAATSQLDERLDRLDTCFCCDSHMSVMVSVMLPSVTRMAPPSSSVTSLVTRPSQRSAGEKHVSTIWTSSPTATPSQSRPIATRSMTSALYVTPGSLWASR